MKRMWMCLLDQVGQCPQFFGDYQIQASLFRIAQPTDGYDEPVFLLAGEMGAFHKRGYKSPGLFREFLDHLRGRICVYHWAMVHVNLW